MWRKLELDQRVNLYKLNSGMWIGSDSIEGSNFCRFSTASDGRITEYHDNTSSTFFLKYIASRRKP